MMLNNRSEGGSNVWACRTGGTKNRRALQGHATKVQFVATVAHNPKLLILDEPFTGLDPLNADLLKDEIYQLNQQGVSIIFQPTEWNR